MPRIFLSYRREDTSGHARHLFEQLASRYRKKNVFMDVTTLQGGDAFVDRIDQAVARSDSFLVLIGKRWLDARDESGHRRLEAPGDYVRREIASALAQKVKVIPILVDGATMPPPEQLPEDLRGIAVLNAVGLTSERWDYELERLLELLPSPPRKWVMRSVVASGAAIGVLAVVVMLHEVLWPAPKPMTGLFNVAVLDFGESEAEGELRSSPEGHWIAEQVYDRLHNLNSVSKSDPNMNGVIEVGRLELSVTGHSTDIGRSLVEIADAAKATIVVHGVLELSRLPYRFTPYLYLTQQFNGGEELTGESAFGSPIEVTLPLNSSGPGLRNRLALIETLRARVEALQVFTLGLAYIQIGNPDRALELFNRADQIPGWTTSGKEVLQLFRGSALMLLKRPDEAGAAYDTSLELSGGKYGRALIGLGNLFFQRGAVDRAAEYYRRALDAERNTPTAYVGAKARFNLGLALASFARRLGETCDAGEARSILDAVVDAYRKNQAVEVLQELAFKAHHQRGVLSQTCADSVASRSRVAEYHAAADQFQAALAIAEPVRVGGSHWLRFRAFVGTKKVEERRWQRDRWVVWKLLGYSQLRLAELGETDLLAPAVSNLQQVTGRFEKSHDVTPAVAAEAYIFLGRALARSDPAAAAAASKRAAEITVKRGEDE